jgi:hypothetical protein
MSCSNINCQGSISTNYEVLWFQSSFC